MAEAKIQRNTREQRASFGYDETLMYGRYTKDLGEYAKREAQKVKAKAKLKAKAEPPSGFKSYQPGRCDSCKRKCVWIRDVVFTKLGEDWIFLTLLGVIMALLSFVMDYAIEKCQEARIWLYYELNFHVAVQFFAWLLFPLVFICFSTGFVHIVGPNAIGSGIPEMKTILRGVVLKEYLTFRTLISKMVGLCTSLGSGMPIGKEGPFVHVASISGTLLGKLVTSFRGIYENESRNSEMLAAACAVGVACTFAAPIGGVLFSIEVTATYFAVRNYWRGFYSAVCGAVVFRLLAIWFKNEETLTALFKTSLREEFPFDPQELLAFAVIGLVCGFAGALFVYTHRRIVEFMRRQKKLSGFLQKNRFIFPSVVVLVISALTFPQGLGQFMAGELSNREAVNELFSNITWATGTENNIENEKVISHWKGTHNNLYVTLVLFIVTRFLMAAIATTLPVPSGVFMPVFTIGAAFGRLMGESMAAWFPNGISEGGQTRHVVPGGYAIVGAAAMSGSVTHTISTSVIVFELTGQIGHVLPAVIAVLISNAVAHTLQPSIYDSIIQIKKLPYLPDIINVDQAINAHRIFVEDFMIRDVKYLTSRSTYREVEEKLTQYKFRAFPMVEAKESMILLGSIQRPELERLLEDHMNPEKRLQEAKAQFRSTPEGTNGSAVSSPVNFADIHVHALPSAPKRSRFMVAKVGEEESKGPDIQVNGRQDSLDKDGMSGSTTPDSLVDVSLAQQSEWEEQRLNQVANFKNCLLDPAPFQLVERTSLYKVHSLFSLLGLHHGYVTNMGRLVGVLALKEVREAIQGHLGQSAVQKNKEQDRQKASKPATDEEGQISFHRDSFEIRNRSTSDA